MKKNINLILDFDSTIITSETLEELAKISLKNDPHKNKKLNQIIKITNSAMNGEIEFLDSLNRRIELLQANQSHLHQLKKHLITKLSPSFISIKKYIQEQSDNIYVVSGGFSNIIYPIVKEFRIIKEHILAQNFTFTKDGIINGVDPTQLLSQKHGKIDAVKSLKLDGTIIAIGDGWTDYQIKEAGLANFFIAFTESVYRKPVTNKGDFIASSFNEVINYIELIKKQ